jgi:hypothetical protein
VSVAQVLHLSGAVTATPSPEAQAVIAGVKAQDGFEHLYLLSNEGEEGLVITGWRDQAAAEAARARIVSAESRAQQASLDATVTPGQVYASFTEL